MKKSVFYSIGLTVATGIAFMTAPTFAASTTTQSWDPGLTQAKSCAEVEGVVKEYFTTNWYGGYFGPMREAAVANDASAQSVAPPTGKGGAGGSMDFSETNTQKTGVDEPDIIKNDGTYIYYADMQQNRQIHIVSVASNKEVATITLPADFWGAQFFVTKGKLIVIGPKTAPYISARANIVANDQKVLVLVYDTTNIVAPKLQNAYEYDGYMQEARLIDGKLVMVTSQPFTWGPVYYFSTDKAVSANAASAPKPEDFAFTARDVLPKRTSMRPTTITYKNGTTKPSTVKTTTQVDCTNVFYKKPDKNAPNSSMWGQSLTSIITFPLTTTNAVPTIKTIVTNSSQVHVTLNSVYVTAPSYIYTPMSCPINARCLSPIRSQGNYTTVHKFSMAGLSYNYSTAVKGTTYNQYSMDDTNGVFRIVTSDRSTNRNVTNVYTINTKGTIAGKLENIAPGEQFHGVRFLDDYLYLVTYRQIDPLFVIDLTNSARPKIVGELKMPGYSTYLHPYAPRQGSIQYLIGIGYNTSVDVDANGNERQGGIKLDLYKADFSQKDTKGNIGVSQVWTKTFGEQGSQTEALNNPRMFVFNNTTKELLLSIVTARTEKTQQCNVVYGTNGQEIRKDCYPMETAITTFAGVKGRKVGLDALTETISIDYKDMLRNPYGYSYTTTTGSIDPWIFGSTMARVGYVGDTYFFINSQFAHLFQKNNLQGTKINFPYTMPMMDGAVPPLKAQG